MRFSRLLLAAILYETHIGNVGIKDYSLISPEVGITL